MICVCLSKCRFLEPKPQVYHELLVHTTKERKTRLKMEQKREKIHLKLRADRPLTQLCVRVYDRYQSFLLPSSATTVACLLCIFSYDFREITHFKHMRIQKQ